MERKLVTIRRIADVLPIEGADQIELVKIDGWQCVVNKRDSLKQGCAVLYFEVDSFLPESDERFSFLAGRGVQTNGDGSKGYRLRTIKLRGQLSQGLALPLSAFPEAIALHCTGDETDYSELLGVTKWEPALPAQLAGQAKGYFPEFLRKTDQERVQNMPWVLEDEGEWEITQKLDGSSCTIFFKDGAFGVCSRNLELKDTEGNSFWSIAKAYSIGHRLASLGMNIALQGELVGPGVQGNIHKLPQLDLYIFDIWLIDEQRYATPHERDRLMHTEQLHGLKHVPLVEIGTLDHIRTLDSALSFADRVEDQICASNKTPEGLVFKKMDGSMSFKIISNRYLLKEK